MTVFVVVLALAGFGMVAYIALPRLGLGRIVKRRTAVTLYVWDGAYLREHKAKWVDGYLDVGGGKLLGRELLRPVHSDSGDERYIHFADPVQYADHIAYEAMRVKILRGRFLKPGGDMVETIRMIASVVMLVTAAMLWMQANSFNRSLATLEQRVVEVQEILQKPLNIAPAPPPLP